MGRKLLVAFAVAGLSLVAAIPAVAKDHKRTLIMSTRVGAAHKISRSKAAARTSVLSANPTTDTVLYAGYRSECTAPNGPGLKDPNGQNLFTSDTMEMQTTSGELVASCMANLKHTKGTDGKRIAYNTQAVVSATVQSCRVFNQTSQQGPTVLGTGVSITFPNGLFFETCTALPPV
jgi:hypothetical protein